MNLGLSCIFVFLMYAAIYAQKTKIADTGVSDDPSAVLQVESTDKGVLLPRMTEMQRNSISNPAVGLLIFQTDVTQGFYYWTGGCWQMLGDNIQCTPGPSYPPGSVHCNGTPTAIVDVTNPSTGKTWMDRNLGATQAATSITDTDSYGDLYQWGRGNDGHQCRNSSTTNTMSSNDQPGHGNFILTSSIPHDWRSGHNTNLWQGVNGINNPCPSGYRIPTETELENERLTWSSYNASGALSSPLKMPMGGYRDQVFDMLDRVDTYGYFWSSNVNSTNSRNLIFNSSSAYMDSSYRAYGFSVRCIKD